MSISVLIFIELKLFRVSIPGGENNPLGRDTNLYFDKIPKKVLEIKEVLLCGGIPEFMIRHRKFIAGEHFGGK